MDTKFPNNRSRNFENYRPIKLDADGRTDRQTWRPLFCLTQRVMMSRKHETSKSPYYYACLSYAQEVKNQLEFFYIKDHVGLEITKEIVENGASRLIRFVNNFLFITLYF